MYDQWKLRSDLDDLARHHVQVPEDEDNQRWQCFTCGEWQLPETDGHIVGWDKVGLEERKRFDCPECYSKRPEVLAGREWEAALDRKDGK